jgi:hypothetical protein
MQFTIEQQLAGEPAAVEAALFDPAFITARAGLPKLGDAELLESSRVAHVAEHRVVPDHYADRLQCSYRATIEPVPGGSRRVLAGTVKVRMPLVGGRVERAIGSGLAEHAAAEAALLDEWLARPR